MFHKPRLRTIGWSLVGAALACTAAGTASAATAASSTPNVARWLTNATKSGTASASQTVDIAVNLKLSNSAALKAFVASVSSPKSKNYGQYLTSHELSQYAANAADVAAVKTLLETAGMTKVTVGPLGAYITATATVAQLKSTFKVSQDLYAYKGLTLRANKEEPTLPKALVGKVVYIEGLNQTTALRKHFNRSVQREAELVAPSARALSAEAAAVSDAATAGASTSAITPPPVAANLPSPYCNYDYGTGVLTATLSTPADVYGASVPWLNCGYTPGQIRDAYGFKKTKYDGTGITVAIVDAYASPTLLADGQKYATKHNLTPLVFGKNFKLDIPAGIYGVDPSETCGPYGWWGEQSLDLAAVHGSAPGANILYVGSRDCDVSLDVALYNVLYKHAADVVTNSYGYNGEAINPGQQASDDQAFLVAAAQGITVLFSSGDDGDVAAINGVASGAWPATSSYVTGVGGTTLLLGQNGAKSEYGWGTYRAYLTDVAVKSAKSVITSGVAQVTNFGVTYDDFSYYSGAGGGISLLEFQPAYQAGIVPNALATTLNLASGLTEPLPYPQRVSPDIALVADPYTGYLIGESFTIANDKFADAGCTKTSGTTEYCEIGYGGTSLSSPLMAGVAAVLNQKRKETGEPLLGFANPLLYYIGSGSDGVNLTATAINQIVAPKQPTSLLRGYASDLTRLRVITVNSVPFLIVPAPYALEACSYAICEGLNEVFNYTSLSTVYAGTPAGYNDVTGLGVPYLPKLLTEE